MGAIAVIGMVALSVVSFGIAAPLGAMVVSGIALGAITNIGLGIMSGQSVGEIISGALTGGLIIAKENLSLWALVKVLI